MGKAIVVLGSLLGLWYVTVRAFAYSPSGWTKGHATFYGGSDASGTMGKLSCTYSTFSSNEGD